MAKDKEAQVITYVCANPNCKAEDSARADELIQALNCWSCHAGQKLTLAEMFQKKSGMFPKGMFLPH